MLLNDLNYLENISPWYDMTRQGMIFIQTIFLKMLFSLEQDGINPKV
jgi:hypothetical protein